MKFKYIYILTEENSFIIVMGLGWFFGRFIKFYVKKRKAKVRYFGDEKEYEKQRGRWPLHRILGCYYGNLASRNYPPKYYHDIMERTTKEFKVGGKVAIRSPGAITLSPVIIRVEKYDRPIRF